MKHAGTQKIKTNRLILRQFTLDDAEMMFYNWTNDDDVTKFLPWNTHSSINTTKEILTEWVNNYKKPDFYQWCIEYDKNAIGSITVIDINEELKTCEIGYCIGKNWWNKGITTEALNAIKEYLINDIKFEHLWAWHHINNPNSGKVLAKCGFKLTQIIKDCEKYLNTNSKIKIYEFKHQQRL